jgi:hypothetical protein
MRASSKGVAVAVLAVSSCGWAGATVGTARQTSESKLVVPVEQSSEGQMRVSLRRDIARHPSDFVSFPTETSAMRFMKEHSMETSRETEQRMRDLGVMGYWQGRTVVVLPIAPAMER